MCVFFISLICHALHSTCHCYCLLLPPLQIERQLEQQTSQDVVINIQHIMSGERVQVGAAEVAVQSRCRCGPGVTPSPSPK